MADLLSREDFERWVKPSDWEGAKAVGFDWAVIASSLALVGAFPSVWLAFLVLPVIAGRQLGLAVCVHDATHYALFRRRRVGEFVAKWICGGPVWQDLVRYRAHHWVHHRTAGLPEDPDVSLVQAFPISKRSLGRKILRDLSGVSGLRRLYGLFLMDLGLLTYTVAADPKPIPKGNRTWAQLSRNALSQMLPMLVANGVLLLICFWMGKTWLYILWVLAYLTWFSLFLRLRSIAEHACRETSADPLKSTRTTLASIWERAFVAPHHVNYHLEHHLSMAIPPYRLPEVHEHLQARGVLLEGSVVRGYRRVLRLVTTS